MKEKNIGVELLRNVSMLFAVVLHVLNAGGILDGADRNTYYAKLAYTFFIAAFCGVNCFALISGYVGWKSKVRLSRLLYLWILTFFYSVIITLIFYVIKPDAVTPDVWKASLLPITSSQYWYVTAYFGMMVFAPLLNVGISQLSEKCLRIICICIFVFASVVPTISKYYPYGLANGYSAIWLCALYVIGGYLSRFRIAERVKSWQMFLMYGITAFATFMAYRRQHWEFIEYTSPTITICAVALLLFCVNLRFDKKSIWSKSILLLSPSALSVFLIHVHPLVYGNVIAGCSGKYLEYSLIVFVILIIATVFAIYFACVLIDVPRRLLFKAVSLDRRLCVIDDYLQDKNKED